MGIGNKVRITHIGEARGNCTVKRIRGVVNGLYDHFFTIKTPRGYTTSYQYAEIGNNIILEVL